MLTSNYNTFKKYVRVANLPVLIPLFFKVDIL